MPRLTRRVYAGGNSEMVDRGNARTLSNTIGALNGPAPPNKQNLNMLFVIFGQFMDHDLDLTFSNGQDPAPIKVPKGDPSFDPSNSGTGAVPFSRSKHVLRNG